MAATTRDALPAEGTIASPCNTLLVKPVSARCNLACRYCFYRDRPDDPYSGLGVRLMSRELLSGLVAQHLRHSPDVAAFAWQGGEPALAGLDFYRQAVAYQARYGASGQLVSNSLQTNGLALDDEWGRFLARYRFLVGLSLDGPAEVHDAWRQDAQGRGSHAQAVAGLRLLRRHGVAANVLAVVHRHSTLDPERLLGFFHDEGVSRVQFIPALDRVRGSLADHAVEPQQYADFLCALFDAWYNGGRPEVSVRLFDNLVARAAGLRPEMCELGGRCDSYVVVEYNGDVYPCDFFVAPEHYLGNIGQQPLSAILAAEGRLRFVFAREQVDEECSECPWLDICAGGCLRYRVAGEGVLQGRNYLCSATRAILEHAWDRLQLMASTLPRPYAP